MGDSSSIVSGTHRMSSAIVEHRVVALGGDGEDTRVARAASITFEMSFSWTDDLVAMATSGTSASSSEIGPCFSSPAA